MDHAYSIAPPSYYIMRSTWYWEEDAENNFNLSDFCTMYYLCCTGQSPSVYVIYQFYTFPDHDTAIVPHSTDPQFSDDKLFPVSMDAHLDNYLKKQVRTCTCVYTS